MSSMIDMREVNVAALPPLIGISASMKIARSRLERFARSNLPVLLVGPTGTGKDLLARHLHLASLRSGPMVDVNCGALPRDMVESLLFGHRKGAFTGAIETTVGLIVRADRGTLFLDELSSLPTEGQAKLLRVLETGEVLPLGASAKQAIDFRLVAAAHDDIAERVGSGLFRRDLFHRIGALRIDLPPLAARREDIPLLAEHFARVHGRRIGEHGMAVLRQAPWPGNVRELRGAVDRAALLSDAVELDAGVLLDTEYCSQANACQETPSTELLRLCRVHRGRADSIAQALGVSRATLFRRLRPLGISLASLRVSQSLETR